MSSDAVIPVVLFAYARPQHLQHTLDALRQNHIPHLIAFSDAARTTDKEVAVEEVRAVLRAVDWCEVEIHERETNYGLGKSILSGMTDVFTSHGAAIVFEDDLVCLPGTYDYLVAALRHYWDNKRVMSVSAWTHPRVTPDGLNGMPYFDGRAESWTWGAWARSWAKMSIPAMTLMQQVAARGEDIAMFGADLPQMARDEQARNIWAVRWVYAHILEGGLVLRPPHSMVEHIGFDNGATNAANDFIWSNPPLQPVPTIPTPWPEVTLHPDCIPKWQHVYPKHFGLGGTGSVRQEGIKRQIKQFTPPILWDLLKTWNRYGIRPVINQLLPPIITNVTQRMAAVSSKRQPNRPEWEYMQRGWASRDTDPAIKGWNDTSVLESYTRRWSDFVKVAHSKLPYGISSEAIENDHRNIAGHNVILTFGYVLALAAHRKERLSLLDWGGGIGHYYLYSEALLPNVAIDYTCKDVTVLADWAQAQFPEARFTDSEAVAFDRQYDLVVSSSAMHYTEDWRDLFQRLSNVTSGYLYITRLPTVHHVTSYVMVQRPYAYGFDTEYLGWVINRSELLNLAAECGLALVREFIIEYPPYIHNAPEQCDYWGYLFTPATHTP